MEYPHGPGKNRWSHGIMVYGEPTRSRQETLVLWFNGLWRTHTVPARTVGPMERKYNETMDIKELIDRIHDAAFEVRKHLLPGYLENVYKTALLLELRSNGLKVETEVETNVKYKGVNVGKYRIDMLVEDCVIIELKVASMLTTAHTFQIVNYLTTTGINDGLLINFGTEFQFQHKTRIYNKHS